MLLFLSNGEVIVYQVVMHMH